MIPRPLPSFAPSRALSATLLMTSIHLLGCDQAYPEVVVINNIDDQVMVKDVSFNGCLWEGVLNFEDATSPGHCLPGEDRIHFKKLDVEAHCIEQAVDGTIEGLCMLDAGAGDGGTEEELIEEEPNWFNYQTLTVKRVDYGDFHVFELTADDMEQDFSVPGPYGH